MSDAAAGGEQRGGGTASAAARAPDSPAERDRRLRESPAEEEKSVDGGGRSPGGIAGARQRRYLGVVAALVLVGIFASALLRSSPSVRGIAVGSRIPPFAAPLATGSLSGDVNVATAPHQGSAGERPACSVRGPQVLNVCQLYEHTPLVLALFVDDGSCTEILRQLRDLAPAFAGVSFAAVAIRGETRAMRSLVRADRLSFPVGLDRDGILVTLYGVATCPQVSFVYPGGVVQSPALLGPASEATLRARVRALAAAARQRGRL
ncbi:MAG TPA: hypothetical protein VHU13_02095 [Solirubrobacteraceae bacterium]|nr:hypothetical protein [Solirubrobacteraceae bacterium]